MQIVCTQQRAAMFDISSGGLDMTAQDFSTIGTHSGIATPNSHAIAGRSRTGASADRTDRYCTSDNLLAEVARGNAVLPPHAFARGQVIGRIAELRRYPYWSRRTHALANLLETFYLHGAGSKMLR